MIQKLIKIRTGLINQLDKENIKESDFFWPVLEAIPLEVQTSSEEFAKDFILVFSSKTAVDFFYSSIFIKFKNLFKNCKSVYTVGPGTRDYFNQIFHNECDSEKVFASTVPGMKHTISEFDLTKSPHKILFCITPEGKSREVIESNNFNNSFKIYSLYTLVPYKNNFLNDLFKERENKNIEYIFECHSGKVLEQTVLFLMEYFGCDHITKLPNIIHFSCVGNSTIEKLKKLSL